MFLDQFAQQPFHTPEERQARSLEIVRILRSRVYTDAVERCEAEAIRETLMAPTPEARERARAIVFALGSIGQQLLAMVDDKPLTTTDGIDHANPEH